MKNYSVFAFIFTILCFPTTNQQQEGQIRRQISSENNIYLETFFYNYKSQLVTKKILVSKQSIEAETLKKMQKIGSQIYKFHQPIGKKIIAIESQDKEQYCGSKIVTKPNNTGNDLGNQRAQLVETRYGFKMFVDKKDGTVSRYIKMSGTWEPQYIHLISRIVNPGDNIINIGAQTGLEALVMGKIIGQYGKLFLFQPYSVSNGILTKSIQLNNLQNITTIYKLGASDQKRTSALRINFVNTGGSRFNPQNEKQLQNQNKLSFSAYQYEKVDLDKVDNILPKEVKLDFALIDVETMQIKVLRGMKQVIERSPKLIIMCEWQYLAYQYRNKQQTVQMLQFFFKLNYEIYSYSEGNAEKCKFGKWKKYETILQILALPFIDLFFIPKNHPFIQFVLNTK